MDFKKGFRIELVVRPLEGSVESKGPLESKTQSSETSAIDTHWLTQAKRLNKKDPQEFPHQFDTSSDKNEVRQTVQQFEMDLRLRHHVQEKQRRYLAWAAIAEAIFGANSQGLDYADFKKQMETAIAQEEHYFEQEFYQSSPSEKVTSPAAEITLVLALQLLQCLNLKKCVEKMSDSEQRELQKDVLLWLADPCQRDALLLRLLTAILKRCDSEEKKEKTPSTQTSETQEAEVPNSKQTQQEKVTTQNNDEEDGSMLIKVS